MTNMEKDNSEKYKSEHDDSGKEEWKGHIWTKTIRTNTIPKRKKKDQFWAGETGKGNVWKGRIWNWTIPERKDLEKDNSEQKTLKNDNSENDGYEKG